MAVTHDDPAQDQHREMHSRAVPGGRAYWWTDLLWQQAEGLPVAAVRLTDVPEFDMNCWFGDTLPPTCRAVAVHARRIYEADLSYPVVLSSDGSLMDGGHRLAKAWLAGHQEVAAVRFLADPDPDWVVLDAAQPAG